MPNAEGRIPALMLQGTGTDVGKSLLVAGLGRAFTKRGLSVRPFKPQNMSNNAAVTADGGEIGRAQALQARACGVAPSVHMNPVLLKPQSDIGSQVVVQGKMLTNAKAQDYYQLKSSLLPRVLDSFSSVAEGADLVLIEGAGSAAEVNLRASDIANMGFAEAADVPVLLVGDIDKGGVIASVVGTHALISDAERRRVCGYLINKFRGDKALFEPAIEIIQARTGWPCLGVVRWFEAAGRLPAEDAMALARPIQPAHDTDAPIKIAVPQFARIANFDDLDPLIAEPDVEVRIVPAETALPGDADLVVLAGSKATLSDLAHFRAQGWDVDLAGHVRRGGRVLGLCGGYQMLGRRVADPEGIEGPPGEAEGLGYLDVETTLAPAKTLRETHGTEQSTGTQVRGYEMHIGVTTGPDCARPMLTLSQDGAARPDGAVSADGRIAGCYLHGLFAEDGFRAAYLAALSGTARSAETAYNADVEATLDGLADHLARDIDLDALLSLARR